MTLYTARYRVEAGLVARLVAGTDNIRHAIEDAAAAEGVSVKVDRDGGIYDVEYTGEEEDVERFYRDLRGMFEADSYEGTFRSGG